MIPRFVLCTTGFIALTIAGANKTSAQDSALVRAFRTNSAPFNLGNGRLNGPGADVLSRAARENQFIMVGEDHGFREVPQFVGALFATAQPAGYRHLAVEVGPVTSRRLESMMRSPTAQQDLNAFLARYTPYTIPFFFWKEEAQMLEGVVKSVPSTRGVVWGLDQEFIMSSTYTFERLAQIAPTKAARDLALELAATSAKEDTMMLESKNPGAVWMVASTDADVAKLNAAFSSAPAGSEAAEALRELLVSREIYRMFNAGTNYESNQKRDDLMKQHFLADYRAAQAHGERMPKAIIKLGANHVFRGPSTTQSFEIGSFVPEFVETTGGKSFGILLVVAKGTWNAFRPFGSDEADRVQKYDLLGSSEYEVFDMKSVLAASSENAWTIIDLRPVRALSQNGKLRGLDAKARRLLNSFDAVVVAPEGHASVYIR
jgi:hypothetical protein